MKKAQRLQIALDKLGDILNGIDTAQNMMNDYQDGQGGFENQEEFEKAMDEASTLNAIEMSHLWEWAQGFYAMMVHNERGTFTQP